MPKKQIEYQEQLRRYYRRTTRKARKLSNQTLTIGILSIIPWLRVELYTMVCERCKEREKNIGVAR